MLLAIQVMVSSRKFIVLFYSISSIYLILKCTVFMCYCNLCTCCLFSLYHNVMSSSYGYQYMMSEELFCSFEDMFLFQMTNKKITKKKKTDISDIICKQNIFQLEHPYLEYQPRYSLTSQALTSFYVFRQCFASGLEKQPLEWLSTQCVGLVMLIWDYDAQNSVCYFVVLMIYL